MSKIFYITRSKTFSARDLLILAGNSSSGSNLSEVHVNMLVGKFHISMLVTGPHSLIEHLRDNGK